VVAACATVLVAVGVLAIAGVFSSGSADSATTTSTTSPTASNNVRSCPDVKAARIQGYPLTPIQVSQSGSFQNTIPIHPAIQPLLSQVQAVVITLANDKGVRQAIGQARKKKQAVLTVQGKAVFVGVVGAEQGNVRPIQLQTCSGLQATGAAALGVANKQPFFQLKLNKLQQPPQGSSYILWLALGTAPKQ
jgi:hypothetical protein